MADIPGVPRKEIEEHLCIVIDSQVILVGDLDVSIAYLQTIKTQYPQYLGFTLVPHQLQNDYYGHASTQIMVLGRRPETDEEYAIRTVTQRVAFIEKEIERIQKKPHYTELIKKIDLALEHLSS